MTLPIAPPDPQVVTIMREYRAGLLYQEGAQMAIMAKEWLRVERALEAQIEALAMRAAEIRDAGESVAQWRLLQLDRYQQLLAQAQREISQYNNYAAGLIERKQREYGALGIQHSSAAIEASGQGVVALTFNRLPIEAIENLVGLMANGSPLLAYLERNALPGAVDGLTNALLAGIARGDNPRVTALAMQDGLTGGLQSAMNTARTEQLRVYREANRQNYENSGLVSGYKRISARDGRVCPACLMADNGDVYPLNWSFEGHVNCRCSLIPVVVDAPPIEWESGAQWFMRQPESDQQAILGAGRFEAWQNNQFTLDQLVVRKTDRVWGNALVPATLQQLTGE